MGAAAGTLVLFGSTTAANAGAPARTGVSVNK